MFGPGGGPVYEAARKLLSSEAAVTGEMMVDAMGAAGVSAALLVATSHYGYDSSLSLDAASRYPELFRVVGRIDPLDPDSPEHVARWRKEPFGVSLRIVVLRHEDRSSIRVGRFDRTLAAAEKNRVPLCFVLVDAFAEMESVARAFPDLQIVIDHLGLPRPPRVTHDQIWGEPFSQLLALARYPN